MSSTASSLISWTPERQFVSKVYRGDSLEYLQGQAPSLGDGILLVDGGIPKSDQLAARVCGLLDSFQQVFVVPGGESLKSLEAVSSLISSNPVWATTRGPIVVIGGGALLDSAGFIASVLQRGREFWSIPSTCLAWIDAAHGGKTGLNVGLAKNVVGTFKPPQFVFCSQDWVWSPSEWNSGMSEVLKLAALDQQFWRATSGLTHWQKAWAAVQEKYRYLSEDPWEQKGIRRCLNLGHTFGHALELLLDLSHGHAVALGLFIEFNFLHPQPSPDVKHSIESHLGLFPALALNALPSYDELIPVLAQDKKASRQQVTISFSRTIHKTYPLNSTELRSAYELAIRQYTYLFS